MSVDASSSVARLLKMSKILNEKFFANPHVLDVGITSRDVGLGALAFGSWLRDVARQLIDLQATVEKMKEKNWILQMDLESRLDLDELTDKHQEEIREHYKRLLKEDEDEAGKIPQAQPKEAQV